MSAHDEGRQIETVDSLRTRVQTLEQALRLLHNESGAYRAHVVSWIAISGDRRAGARLEKALVQARLAATAALSGGSTPQCTCEVAPGDKLIRHDADCPARVACPDPSAHVVAEAVTHQSELRAALQELVKQVKKVPGLDTAGAALLVMAAQRACAVLDGEKTPPESESAAPCRKCGRRSEPVPECIRNEARLAGHKWWCAACGYPVGCHYYDAQNAPPDLHTLTAHDDCDPDVCAIAHAQSAWIARGNAPPCGVVPPCLCNCHLNAPPEKPSPAPPSPAPVEPNAVASAPPSLPEGERYRCPNCGEFVKFDPTDGDAWCSECGREALPEGAASKPKVAADKGAFRQPPTEKQPDSSAPPEPAIPVTVLCSCETSAIDGPDPSCALCGGTGEVEAAP